ncbi:hypothetical protein [Noviherbaspirillum malthae]|uniref:hypothetical protein n=1 Tax=Noviherbaspirillum malthae TaxID=1260987 RepID=UPI00188DD1FC|nr:hypothetical protein [Noviherbaspirillum malthae]
MNSSWLTESEIAEYAHLSENITQQCNCSKQTFDAWESLPVTFPEEQLERKGAVTAPSDKEATVREYHPRGTNYWSSDAPIALHYFPANRSDVWQCKACKRCFLRYTEFGGYYIDKRIRALRASLLFAGPYMDEDVTS